MIYGIFGLPGSGKSYILAYEAYLAMKQGKYVFSNYPIFHKKYGATYKLSLESLKKCEFPPNSLLIIDEAGHIFNSRNWKNFDMSLYIMFTQHRHQGLDIMYGSQGAGRVDVVIRELTNVFYWVDNVKIPWISNINFINKILNIPYIGKLNIPFFKLSFTKKILFFKSKGVTDINYLGLKHISKEYRSMVVYGKKYYLFKKSISESYDTLALKKNTINYVLEKWDSK